VSAALNHILMSSVAADDRTRVLKHADAFGVFDHHGDIVPAGLGEQGLYSHGTRFLSTFLIDLDGARPFFLGATVRDEHAQLVTSFTNPDLERGGVILPLGTIHLSMRTFLWEDVLHRRIDLTNYASSSLDVEITFHFATDFADIFAVRGMKRKARGVDLDPILGGDRVVLAYRGLDNIERRTVVGFSAEPMALDRHSARFALTLSPGRERTLEVSIACQGEGETRSPDRPAFRQAWRAAESDLERYRSRACQVRTGNERANAWCDRAVDDLHMLTTSLATGPYPYAGIPWFNTPFGRDGILTAFECLWVRPQLAKGVLCYLASTQATELVPEEDAEPGKILHETRSGEMARTGEMPFRRYYGAVDATPLFIMLAGEYFRRTNDIELARSLWPHLKAALDWIHRFGDRDADRFVEYQRRASDGLLHQGWKDSDDAIVHADGSPAKGPIALAEVQGYVYAAWRSAALIARALGRSELAQDLEGRAELFRTQFDEAFWCEELGTYALALDGDKKACRVRTSNAGQCLFSGIALPRRATQIAQTLLSPESFSGWGVRTLAANEVRYNPMGYHTGAVWPHDTALIALGLARYGHTVEALGIFSGLLSAGLSFDLHRMPELFCGFPRVSGEGPVRHPAACAPQAWAAGSVLLLLQACLGLEVDGIGRRVVLTRPQVPVELEEIRIHDLDVGGARLDLSVYWEGNDVAVRVLRRENDVQVIVMP
jgi:glycogen debranching enzyme